VPPGAFRSEYTRPKRILPFVWHSLGVTLGANDWFPSRRSRRNGATIATLLQQCLDAMRTAVLQ
jgi:hypothetical protein